jgi:hypothetical protein
VCSLADTVTICFRWGSGCIRFVYRGSLTIEKILIVLGVKGITRLVRSTFVYLIGVLG